MRVLSVRALWAGLFFAVCLLLPEAAGASARLGKRPDAAERERIARLVRDASGGYDAAAYRLGMVFLEGKRARQDYAAAVRWLTAAAFQGHVRAMYVLAMLYARGQGVERDLQAAYGWVSRLAQAGHRMAQYNLGRMFELGEGAPQDAEQARLWYGRAAQQGSPSALHRLAQMDDAALAVEMADPARRKALLRRADRDARSQYLLGRAYMNGFGTARDEAAGREWMLRAAESGEADAQYEAAYFFPAGGEGREAYAAALAWTEKAARAGQRFAAFNLAGMYEHGKGLEKDWDLAGKWYVYSAGLGNANAIQRLHLMGETCRRFPERPVCSGFSLRDMAAGADVLSLYRAGLALKDGDGLQQDWQRALFWLRLAAGRGHAGAQYELGDMYENGLGTGRSAAQAGFWYARAAASGHAGAAGRLKALGDREE